MKKIQSILFLFLFLASTLGLSINAHVCQGSIKSIALFQKAKTCEMSSNGTSCESKKSQDGLNKTPCCQSVDGFGLSHFHTTQKSENTTNQRQYVNVKWFVLLNSLINNTQEIVSMVDHPPPDINQVKPTILFEVFLI